MSLSSDQPALGDCAIHSRSILPPIIHTKSVQALEEWWQTRHSKTTKPSPRATAISGSQCNMTFQKISKDSSQPPPDLVTLIASASQPPARARARLPLQAQHEVLAPPGAWVQLLKHLAVLHLKDPFLGRCRRRGVVWNPWRAPCCLRLVKGDCRHDPVKVGGSRAKDP